MTETAIRFGTGRGKLGIYHRPDDAHPDAPTVILLNAGLLHRAGPHRLNVKLARRVGALGIPSLRFDMSGIGDSTMQREDLSYVERSQVDITEAMDVVSAMEEHSGGFVMVGLCSGAFNALRIAVVDPRVRGCVFLDGYSFPTFQYRVRHYLPRLVEGDRWVRYAKRRLGIGPTPTRDDDTLVFQTENIPRQRYHDELAALIDRQVAMLFVFTGGGPQPFNYENQLHDAFGDLDFTRTRFVWMPEADHTYTLEPHRERLLATVVEWLRAEIVGVPG